MLHERNAKRDAIIVKTSLERKLLNHKMLWL